MTGADKIIEKITRDAQAKSEEILARAEAQAEQTLAQAAAQAREASRTAMAAAGEKASFDIAAARSRTAMTEKRILLQMKNEVIGQVVASALARLQALPEAEYFGILVRLAAEYASHGLPGVTGQGEMRLSQRDLDRLPPDFKPAGVSISPQPAGIEGGFILAYGDIEQNCSFEALVSVCLDDIKDALHAFIFA